MAKVSGSGTIYQLEKDKPKGKCRKWQLRVSTGRDPRTGKYGTRTRTFNGTYTEAKAAMRSFIEDVEDGRSRARAGFTFEEYARRFLDERRAKGEVAVATIKRLESQYRAASRHIGSVRLDEVTPQMLSEMYASMLSGDTLSGARSSGSTVNLLHKSVSLLLKRAVKEGVLGSNPCDRVDAPRTDTKSKKAIGPEKVRELVETLDPEDTHELAYLLALTLGLRRGEICGLSWRDVDFERGIVDVSHGCDDLGNLKDTKTKAGMRLLPLPTTTLGALLEAKEAQAARFARENEYRDPSEPRLAQTGDTPVIVTRHGERVSPELMSRWWYLDRDALGLGDYTLHELRHTYLSLLAMGGVHPKVMQDLAGHCSSRITMEIYTHVNMEQKRRAAEVFSDLVCGPGAEGPRAAAS